MAWRATGSLGEAMKWETQRLFAEIDQLFMKDRGPAMEEAYILFAPNGGGMPSRIHKSIEEAKTEAERICRKANKTIQIFSLIGEVTTQPSPLVWTLKKD